MSSYWDSLFSKPDKRPLLTNFFDAGPAILPSREKGTHHEFWTDTGAPDVSDTTEVLQQKFNKRATRLLQILHAVRLANGPVLVPTLALNVFGPEDYYPEEQLCWGTVSQPQTAAQTSILQIFNSTGQLLVIESVEAARLQTAGEIEIRLAAGAQGTFNNPNVRDLRLLQSGNFPPGVRCDFVAGPASTNRLLARIWSGAAQNPGIARAIIIPPAAFVPSFTSGILLQPTIINEGLSATFYFRQLNLTNPGIN